MSLSQELSLSDARPEHLPHIAALRDAAGWAVHEWALRAVIGSANARCVVVTDGNSLVAVGSGAVYGPIGFVGNMIVAETHRRRGIGSHVLRTILDYLHASGASRIELFATEAGRPLYERHGFVGAEPSVLATVPRSAIESGDRARAVTIEAAQPDALTEVAAYDLPRFGGDRAWLLALLSRTAGHPLLVARRDGGIAGYAWLRAEAGRIGPFVADEPAVAAELMRAAFGRRPDVESLSTNLPMANSPGIAWLEGIGVELEPWDRRMALGPPVPQRLDTIYGNSVGALG